MATLNQTYGITLVVNKSTTEYGGAGSNQFFGGSSDRIAMLRFNAPDALGGNDVLTAASVLAWFKADTTPDSDTITIGLISGSWTTTTTTFSTLYGYITGSTTTASISTTTTDTQKTLAITSLLQTWAANPSAYSGIYFRKSTLSLCRIGTGSTITTTVETRTACTAPSSVSLAKTTADPGEVVNLSWSGAGAGTLNPIVGYIIQRSENGGAWGNWATDNKSPHAVTTPAAWGTTWDLRIVTDGQYIDSGVSASVRLTTRYPTACGTPSSISLAKTTADPSENVLLSWSGATAGTLNAINGYKIQRQEGAGSWADWQTVATAATSGSYTVAAHSTWGSTYSYRVITTGAAGATYYSPTSSAVTLTTRYPTACTAPTSASVAPNPAESSPTLTWSGATSGTLNAISSYEIQYSESTDLLSWGSWTALKTVTLASGSGTTDVDLPATRGHYRKYQIRARGAAGASYYSPWKETNAVRFNQLPTPPTSFTASPEVYATGEITLSYPGATDPDGNLSTYNVQYAVSTDNGVTWGSWVSLANAATTHTPTLNPGNRIKYQVRSVDSLAAVSAYVESNSCGKNTAPAAPVVSLPQSSKTTHNSRPRFLITLGADPEGHLQTIAASGYTPSRSSNLAGGDKIVLRKATAAAPGAVALSITSTDIHGEASSAAARSTTYAVPSYTDDPIIKGTSRIKAAHITELRTMTNTVRAYYGLAAVSWAEAITAGLTSTRNWVAHILELRSAIDSVISLVNGWDLTTSTNRIPVPSWLQLTTGAPRADAMEQIRATIQQL